ncbi:Bug family tripartite tricarboxylate transporter substrate binding protein [Pseudoroseomonas ludipueritiae]|uniref:Tripartite tricarboxylate transporter substrate binding protein n=1 Tax=Pseudoroseomonas ludipueritiae TaxID=198093 RepID=A0ABR7R1P4_9PROT|nr:tripartite tricarboxylate transporter substrate binding protein [Pseudoroseomonas ludipueritiae]MBC9175622.1 tripartite tricarboxylate transporter substrate binding protein [Pseudoroseomonas ludipueritiae]
MKNVLPLGRRRLALGALAAGMLPLAARAAWPEAPIKWIVAYPAGGGTDTLARVLGAALSRALGQPVVIDNRPGAATNIGADAAAHAAPDGLTLFSADNGTLVFNPALFSKLSYNPEKDFRPVGLMARFPLVLAVKQDSAIRDGAGLVEAARRAPGAIDYGSPGVGSPHHLTMERLARETKIQLNHIPYRGMAPAMNDLLAGRFEAAVLDIPSGGEYLKAGRGARAIAVCGTTRHPELPEIPTVEEAFGLRGFQAAAWQGLVVPARTPDAVVQRLTAELARALADQAARARLQSIGLELLEGGPEEFRALLAAEREIWVPLIRSLGITLD